MAASPTYSGQEAECGIPVPFFEKMRYDRKNSDMHTFYKTFFKFYAAGELICLPESDGDEVAQPSCCAPARANVGMDVFRGKPVTIALGTDC